VQHPSNPDTLSLTLAKSVIKYCDLDTAIYITSRALEILCTQLLNEMKNQEARQLASSAVNYARVCRELAEQSRDKQKLMDRAK
jgi:hypothetical protein